MWSKFLTYITNILRLKKVKNHSWLFYPKITKWKYFDILWKSYCFLKFPLEKIYYQNFHLLFWVCRWHWETFKTRQVRGPQIQAKIYFLWSYLPYPLPKNCHTHTHTPGLPFGLFWNCLPEIKWFGHLAIFGLF